MKKNICEQDARLDNALVFCIEGLSRSQAQAMILGSLVKVNELIVTKVAFQVRRGDSIHYDLLEPDNEDSPKNLVKENSRTLDILFEDEDYLVINKAAGLTVHPGAGTPLSETLVNDLILAEKLTKWDLPPKIQACDAEFRPGVVHRLDKEASGAMLLLKNPALFESTKDLFKNNKIKRGYLALSWGAIDYPQLKNRLQNFLELRSFALKIEDKKLEIESLLGRHPVKRKKQAVLKDKGRRAHSAIELIKSNTTVSLYGVKIATGRTHQIRVHLSFLGVPIVGDRIYGKKKDLCEQMFLHARELSFEHPKTNKTLVVSAPLSDKRKELLLKHELML